MTYRFLTGEDALLLTEFNGRYFADGWNKAQLDGAFKNDGFTCLGAFDGERLIGYITYTLVEGVADLDDVVVLPEKRKQGIGYALVSACIDDLVNKQADKILLEVRQSNLSAINLYVKTGFVKISQRKKYYSNGEDAFVFQKEL